MSGSWRVVFDTSTLVSAALRVGSLPHRALTHVLREGEVCVSLATLAELDEVLTRPKFDRYQPTETRSEFAAFLRLRAAVFDVSETQESNVKPACRDPKDNQFLAAEGDAENYDRVRALFPVDVLAWVQGTQPKAWETLTGNQGAKAGETLLDCLRDLTRASLVLNLPPQKVGAGDTVNPDGSSGSVRRQQASTNSGRAHRSALHTGTSALAGGRSRVSAAQRASLSSAARSATRR